jgi:hypothetical protein
MGLITKPFLNVVFACFRNKLKNSKHIAVIGYRNTGHFVIDRFFVKDLISEAHPIKKIVCGNVNVQKSI